MLSVCLQDLSPCTSKPSASASHRADDLSCSLSPDAVSLDRSFLTTLPFQLYPAAFLPSSVTLGNYLFTCACLQSPLDHKA